MVAAGAFHRAAVTGEGTIWTCGVGDQGQLGHGDEQDRLRPMGLGVCGLVRSARDLRLLAPSARM